MFFLPLQFIGFLKTFLLEMRLSDRQGASGKKRVHLNDLQELPDEQLMAMYASTGNSVAFECLMNRYQTQIYGFLVRSCQDRSAAEDLYQETFIRVIKAAPTYRPAATFRTWIFTIARNLLIDFRRRQRTRIIMVAENPSGDDTAGDSPDLPSTHTETNPDQMLEAVEMRRILNDIIDQLPEEQKEMVYLREQVDLDFQDASTIAGCSVNTAKSRMRYALIKIREELIRRGIFPGRSSTV